MIRVLTIEVTCSECEQVAYGTQVWLEGQGWFFWETASPYVQDATPYCPRCAPRAVAEREEEGVKISRPPLSLRYRVRGRLLRPGEPAITFVIDREFGTKTAASAQRDTCNKWRSVVPNSVIVEEIKLCQ